MSKHFGHSALKVQTTGGLLGRKSSIGRWWARFSMHFSGRDQMMFHPLCLVFRELPSIKQLSPFISFYKNIYKICSPFSSNLLSICITRINCFWNSVWHDSEIQRCFPLHCNCCYDMATSGNIVLEQGPPKTFVGWLELTHALKPLSSIYHLGRKQAIKDSSNMEN